VAVVLVPRLTVRPEFCEHPLHLGVGQQCRFADLQCAPVHLGQRLGLDGEGESAFQGCTDGDETVNNVTTSSDPRVVVDFLPGLLVKVTVPPDVTPGEVAVTYAISDYFRGEGTGRLTILVMPGNGSPPSTAEASTTVVPATSSTLFTGATTIPTNPSPTDPTTTTSGSPT